MALFGIFGVCGFMRWVSGSQVSVLPLCGCTGQLQLNMTDDMIYNPTHRFLFNGRALARAAFQDRPEAPPRSSQSEAINPTTPWNRHPASAALIADELQSPEIRGQFPTSIPSPINQVQITGPQTSNISLHNMKAPRKSQETNNS